MLYHTLGKLVGPHASNPQLFVADSMEDLCISWIEKGTVYHQMLVWPTVSVKSWAFKHLMSIKSGVYGKKTSAMPSMNILSIVARTLYEKS